MAVGERVGLARAEHEDEGGVTAKLLERAHASIAVDDDALSVVADDDEHGVLLPADAERGHQLRLGLRVGRAEVREIEREQPQLHLRRAERQGRVHHAVRETMRAGADAISARDTSTWRYPGIAHSAAKFGSRMRPTRRVTATPSRARSAQDMHTFLHDIHHLQPELGA